LVPPELRSNPAVTSQLLLGIPFYGYDFEVASGGGEVFEIFLLKLSQAACSWAKVCGAAKETSTKH
jgi:hypothetical protein